jgi:hypothetical protein
MKKFAVAMLDQQKVKSRRKLKPQRQNRKR